MINLAEQAEAFVKRQKQKQSQRSASGSISTKTGIENRASKQKRIQEAIQRQKQ